MRDYVKLHKYFFEISDFDISEGVQGETKRSRAGKVFTDISSDPYKEFELEINRVNKTQHGQLLYLTTLALPIDDGGQDLDFISPYGDEYTVTIPVDEAFDYTPTKGREETYNWSLTLWEVEDDG